MFYTTMAAQNGRMRAYRYTGDMPVPVSYTDTKPNAGGSLLINSINDGCVGCWLFNEGTGLVANDLSSFGRHGALLTADTSVPTWGISDNGQTCIEFGSGDNSYVQCNGWGSIAPTTEMTFLIKQYANTATVQNTICCDNSIGGIINALLPWSGNVCYWDAGNASSMRISYTPDVPVYSSWQTWVLTASATGNYSKMYRNGVLEHSGTITPSFTQANVPFYIGCAPSSNYFVGKIDVIRVWDRALSDSEIGILSAGPFTGIGD
jgi:hypothetical protein